jgi:hypothetical protein
MNLALEQSLRTHHDAQIEYTSAAAHSAQINNAAQKSTELNTDDQSVPLVR